MKKKLNILLSVLMLLSLVLTACGGAPAAEPAAVVEEPAAEEVAVEAPAAESVAEEPVAEPVEMTEPDLDGAFNGLLANMTGYNTIKADGLLEAMASDTPPFLLDVRTAGEVEEAGHIEGAVHVALADLTQHLDLLPAFDAPIVAYCGSGWRATIAMTALSALGWSDVKALKVTFAEWKDAGNPVAAGLPEDAPALNAAAPDPALVAEVEKMLAVYGVKPFGGIDGETLNTALGEKPEMVVIDVRTAAEVEEKGSMDAGDLQQVNIPLEEFVANKDLWPADLSTEIAVYCGSGHRSTMAMTILGSYGYTNVLSLKGGFGGWADAGFATVGGVATEAAAPDFDAVFSAMLANMSGYNTVKADALLTEMVEDQPPFLLDVRTTEEVQENGHIEGATHIPLAELAQHIDLLPAFDTPIVTYCGSGWRATIAMTALSGMGWTNVRALKTAFADWVAAGNPVAEGLPEPMALNAAEVDPAVLAAADAMLAVYGNKPFGGVAADDLNLTLGEQSDLVLIDVRKTDELVENGVIDSGDIALVSVPLEDFIAQMALWPADKDAKIVVYCGSGHRSTMAMTILGFYGYTNVSSLKGGFGDWTTAEYPVKEYALP